MRGSDTGVFVGAFLNDYSDIMSLDPSVDRAHQATGVGIAMLANRISYWFNLHGPSMTIDTACSASAAAVNLAFESLQSGTSKMALASGANLILAPGSMLSLSAMKFVSIISSRSSTDLSIRFLSPDGKSYMFDSRANGYARGEGIGTILMKPLEDALRDNDPIHAIIRNIGVNQDGKTPGITLPSQEAQLDLMKRTYRRVGLDPVNTNVLEAHGTGTIAGDKAEAKALALGLDTARRSSLHPLNVVSVKTKIGHCEAAAGIAGIIHSLVALRNRTVFPNCNFEHPSTEIDFEGWKIKVSMTYANMVAHPEFFLGSNKVATLGLKATSKSFCQ